MAKSTRKLTKSWIAEQECPAGKKSWAIWDSEVRGFGVRFFPSGQKSYCLKYRTHSGHVRWLTLGSVGGLTVEEARVEARKARARVDMGEDPAAAKAEARKAETIAQLIDLYEAEGLFVQRGKRLGEPMKPLNAQFTVSRLRNHVVPLLGKHKAREVTAGDIEKFVRDVAAGKTSRDEKVAPRKRIIVRGGEGSARKVVRDLSAVFSFAARRGIVATNPVLLASVRKTDNRRENFLELNHIRRLGEALDAAAQDGVNHKAIDQIKLLVLTGCRRNEILALRWDEIDFKNGRLTLSDSKTGKSNRPLGAAALIILAGIKKTNSPYVFPAERGDGYYLGMRRHWKEFRKSGVLPDETKLHTLRHSLGSLAASSGESLVITGALLGHQNLRSTQIYAHVAQDPARRAAERVSGAIAGALARSTQAEVVPHPSAAKNIIK